MSLIEELSVEFEPGHYACLAVFGNAVRNGFEQPEYEDRHVDSFVGLEVSDKLESLQNWGYLEKTFVESRDGRMYRLADDEQIKYDAEKIMEHVDRTYDGKVYEFVDSFDDEDVEQLVDMGVEIVDFNI